MQRKLLLIEDYLPYARILAKYLKSFSYNVEIAQSAAEGKKIAFSGFWPDCVLLDYNLPDINGDVVLGSVRGNPETRMVPVILMSNDETQEVPAYGEYGADGFYFKSSPLEKCRAMIEGILHRVDAERGIITRGDIRLEKTTYSVFWGQTFHKNLSQEQFCLFELLVFKSPNHVDEETIARLLFRDGEHKDKSDAIRALAHRLRRSLGKRLGNRIKSRADLGWVYIAG